MSKAEKTKAFIIEKSAQVFNMKGYAGTSLSDIMEVTGLTKGSIYGNFENKNEVAIAVYKYNISDLKRKLNAVMDPHESAKEKLLAFTRFYRTNCEYIFEKGGCPILNAAIEADDNLSFLKSYVQQSIVGLANKLGAAIKEGQARSEFKPTVDSQKSAYDIITILEGGMMLSKIMNTQKFLFSALDRIEVLIDIELSLRN